VAGAFACCPSFLLQGCKGALDASDVSKFDAQLMTRPVQLSETALETALIAAPGWSVTKDGRGLPAIQKHFSFANFSDALAFVVQVGLAAEKADHHPDVTLSWGKASVLWTTHDAGGLTELDFTLAKCCNAFAA
jgi:4a-hydroxytetrahydrobiopterin dehydratase